MTIDKNTLDYLFEKMSIKIRSKTLYIYMYRGMVSKSNASLTVFLNFKYSAYVSKTYVICMFPV